MKVLVFSTAAIGGILLFVSAPFAIPALPYLFQSEPDQVPLEQILDRGPGEGAWIQTGGLEYTGAFVEYQVKGSGSVSGPTWSRFSLLFLESDPASGCWRQVQQRAAELKQRASLDESVEVQSWMRIQDDAKEIVDLARGFHPQRSIAVSHSEVTAFSFDLAQPSLWIHPVRFASSSEEARAARKKALDGLVENLDKLLALVRDSESVSGIVVEIRPEVLGQFAKHGYQPSCEIRAGEEPSRWSVLLLLIGAGLILFSIWLFVRRIRVRFS
ncbi:MAG: hypothetical protein JXR96_12935 [Deltaproteobacteria bacterium]|nr:hypothetical protein [Deltaproteobacteria bacterium]